MVWMSPESPLVLRLRSLAALGDSELLVWMKRTTASERTLSVYALVLLGEIQRRKLHEDAGFSSMFTYCVVELGYSEANAYRRLQAAGAARNYPEVLTLIKDGSLTVCALSVIAKHLTRENCSRVLNQIEGKSVRVVERLAAELAPEPDTKDIIRTVSTPTARLPKRNEWATVIEAPAVEPPIAESPAIDRPAVVPVAAHAACPLAQSRLVEKIYPRSPERSLFRFTGSEELRRVVDRCRELLWHRFPAGRLEDIFLELGQAYLRLKDPELLPPSKKKPPRRTETRWVARWVRSVVYRRDGGRCVFKSVEGRRCDARRGLEYDHILSWARGGRSDNPDNIRLLCRAHNQSAARAAGLV